MGEATGSERRREFSIHPFHAPAASPCGEVTKAMDHAHLFFFAKLHPQGPLAPSGSGLVLGAAQPEQPLGLGTGAVEGRESEGGHFPLSQLQLEFGETQPMGSGPRRRRILRSGARPNRDDATFCRALHAPPSQTKVKLLTAGQTRAFPPFQRSRWRTCTRFSRYLRAHTQCHRLPALRATAALPSRGMLGRQLAALRADAPPQSHRRVPSRCNVSPR
jgi:hypothetical protein